MLTRHEACLYFGVEEDELEELVLEHELMVELGSDGRISSVHPEGTHEVLHVRFERQHGFRPDDPMVKAEAEAYREEADREHRKHLKRNAVALKERVAKKQKQKKG